MAAQKYPSVLMFGCPGSGKGTQGVALGMLPSFVHFAMGDIFRGLDKASDIGKEFLSYSTKGQLVPDELTIRVFKHHVDEKVAAGDVDLASQTLILDGIPRTPEQVKLLADTIDVKRVVHLVMEDRESLIQRLIKRAATSGRPDDADRGVIENRIAVYEKETFPVLESYPSNLITNVNANQSMIAVLRDVAAALA